MTMDIFVVIIFAAIFSLVSGIFMISRMNKEEERRFSDEEARLATRNIYLQFREFKQGGESEI